MDASGFCAEYPRQHTEVRAGSIPGAPAASVGNLHQACDRNGRLGDLPIVSPPRMNWLRMTRLRPRIGLFDLSDGRSGLTRYVDGILDAVSPSEFDITLFCHPRVPYASRCGIRFCPIPVSPVTVSSTESSGVQLGRRSSGRCRATFSRFWKAVAPSGVRYATGYARSAARIARFIRTEGVDLLHTNECGCMESVLAARLAHVPKVIATYHTDSAYDVLAGRLTPGYRILEQLTNRLLDQAIAVSESTRQDRVRNTRIPASRVITIHNGIDPDKFIPPADAQDACAMLGLPINRVLIGSVGQLQRYKGFDVLLQAFAAAAGDVPQADLVIAGAGPALGELESLVARLGLRSRVHFLGFQSNIPLVLAALDLYVMASRCEALPYALLEAMVAKLPVIATTVGGIPEVIEDGVSGLLVPPGRADCLSKALLQMLRSESLRHRAGIGARERVVQRFHQRDSAERTINVYRQLLKPSTV